LVSIVIALPIVVSLMPMIVNITVNGIEPVRATLTLTAILFAIALPVVIFLGGVLRAYILSAWTLTYRRIAAGSALPEILKPSKEKKEKS
jgi:hypothetical protein